MHHNPAKNVLWWKRDPAGDDEWPVLKDALVTLKAVRDTRTAPYVDTTPYVNWNAMMASAFLHAGAVLDRPECNALALKVLTRISAEAWDEDRGMSHVIGRAVDWALSPVTRIEVSGPRGQGAACNMHLLALQTYRPRKLVVRKTAERPAATVCVGTTCSLPVTTPEALGDLLR